MPVFKWCVLVAVSVGLAEACSSASPTSPAPVSMPAPQVQQPSETASIWVDDFDGPDLDSAIWNVENGRGTFGGAEQVFRPANVSTTNGILRLQARRESSGGRAYTSGAVTTRFKKTFGPEFRLEVRAQIPAFRGGWPAIWTREGAMPNPDVGVEIDLMESIGDGNVVYNTLHLWNAPAHQQILQCAPHGRAYATAMHTYAVEVKAGQIRWFIDDVQTCGPSNVVPSLPSHLIMNLSVGGSWPGPPDSASEFPQNFDIDYVRITPL
jgi:beta-glucanase (GH16 family)